MFSVRLPCFVILLTIAATALRVQDKCVAPTQDAVAGGTPPLLRTNHGCLEGLVYHADEARLLYTDLSGAVYSITINASEPTESLVRDFKDHTNGQKLAGDCLVSTSNSLSGGVRSVPLDAISDGDGGYVVGGGPCNDVAFHSQSSTVWCTSGANLQVYSLDTMSCVVEHVLTVPDVNSLTNGLAFKDNTHLFVTEYSDQGHVTLIELEEWVPGVAPVMTITRDLGINLSSPDGMAFHSDGRMFVATSNGVIAVAEAGNDKWRIDKHYLAGTQCFNLAFGPGYETMFVGCHCDLFWIPV